MEIRGVRDVEDIVLDLVERCRNMIEQLQQKEFLDYICDVGCLEVHRESLLGLEVSMIATEDYFQKAMRDIRDNMKEEQGTREKLVFFIQKYWNLYS